MDENDITIDSCHSRWIFDTKHRRFFRIHKGLGHGTESARTEWRSYFELDLNPYSDSFVVTLNESGTRMLRSWRHMGAVCSQCGAGGTAELSLDDIVRVE